MALTTASERTIRALAHKLQCSLEIKDRRWRLRKYSQCFVGRVSKIDYRTTHVTVIVSAASTYQQEAVDQMVASKMAPNRTAAVNLGKQMVARDLFHHVVHAHDFEVRKCMLIMVVYR